MQPAEFEDILDLLDICFPVPREYIHNHLKESESAPRKYGSVYGMWVDGDLVGSVIYGAIFDDAEGWNGEGMLRYLAVHPSHRRKGYARRIIEKSILHLQQLNCPCVAITILSKNKVALQLWKSFGFEYYGKDEQVDGMHHYYVLWF